MSYRWWPVPLGLLALVFGCSSDGENSASGGGGAAGAETSTGGASASGGTAGAGGSGASASGAGRLTPGSGGDGEIIETLCGEAGCACSNGVDDDDDGKVDGLDEECTGPFDDDEGTFATGIPGDNKDPKWQDCFFDGNSGAGDDGCRYHTDCLYGDKELTDPDCQVVDQCRDFCAARTPNGCDCFGCCDVSFEGTTVNVFIGANCSLENLGDEAACPRCVQTDVCGNECGECELCPGRSVEDLPESCTPEPPPPPEDGGQPPPPPPPEYTCDDGEQVCAATADCEAGFYCALGCCLANVR